MKTTRIALISSLVFMNLAVAAGVHLLWSRGNSAVAAVATVAPTEEEKLIAMIARTSPAVVSILVQKEVVSEVIIDIGPNGSVSQGASEKKLIDLARGTGFLISATGMIVTNRHVAADREAIYTVFLTDDSSFQARILDVDPVQDLALIKIEASGLPYLALSTDDAPRIGSTVVAIGNALGKYSNTVTGGILSGINRSIEAYNEATGEYEYLEDVLQTDAAINSGNSGGPLVNIDGKVIGVNTAIESGAQNLGFAIPSSEVRKALSSYARYASIARPRLGVRTVSLTPDIAQSEGLDHTRGALVVADGDLPAVVSDSPAAKAGILAGDIILEVNGIVIDGRNTLAKLIQNMAVGDQVKLTLARGGTIIALIASLDAHPPYER